MAKRKKGSKVQRRAKLQRGNSAKRAKARKVAKAAKRTVAKAKPKHAPAKKAARKVKQPVTQVIETAAVEVIEQPAPAVITVTEVEETEVRKASWHTGPLNQPATLPCQLLRAKFAPLAFHTFAPHTRLMSAFGTKRTSLDWVPMSALGGKADMAISKW
jgi:hypothetical protein